MSVLTCIKETTTKLFNSSIYSFLQTPHIFELIKQLNEIYLINILEVAPTAFLFFLYDPKFVVQEIGNNIIKPMHSKIDRKHKLQTIISKAEILGFIGSVNSFIRFKNMLHRNNTTLHSSSQQIFFLDSRISQFFSR